MNKRNLRERRDAVIDLYSEGRSQQEIAHKLKISQATVHRDITFERERIRNRSQSWLDEHIPFEHNACTVGINKILRYAWNIVNLHSDPSAEQQQPKPMPPDIHKRIMDALDLAKECYSMKLKLLGDDEAIKHFIDVIVRHKQKIEQMQRQQATTYDQELERRRNRDYNAKF